MKKQSKSAQETLAFAAEVFRAFPNHSLWLLYGDLGAGKTTFVKGLGKHLALDPRKIKSPVFTFVSDYGPFLHYDLYRLEKLDEELLALFHEHLKTQKRVVIEWPERIEGFVEVPHLKIVFVHKGKNRRDLTVTPYPPS